MFFTRFMSSVVLVVLSLFTIFAGGYFLGVVLLFLALTAYRELSKACKLEEDKTGLLGIIGYTGIIAYYVLMVFVENRIYLFLALITILVAFMFVYVFSFPKYKAEQIMCSFFCVAYARISTFSLK